MTTPNDLANQKQKVIEHQIAKALDETRPASWTLKQLVENPDNPKRPDVIETKIQFNELKYPLAANVSHENVERFVESAAR